jgi:hypothetical protein
VKSNKLEREELLRNKVKELSDLTDLFVQKVRELIGTRKMFGKCFIFDGMDYSKVVINEMR